MVMKIEGAVPPPLRGEGGRDPFVRTWTVWEREFWNLHYEPRRLFSEFFGTFLLVVVGAGGGVINAVSHGAIGRAAAVSAPGLLVMAVILFMGAVSGAHLNPVVSIAFALRREFPWRRVPGYVVAQVAGGAAACLLLYGLFGRAGQLGVTVPGAGISDLQAAAMEALLTLGLVSTILGTSSGAQNVGPLSALAVGGFIILAGLFSSPISGASMNPVRSLSPDLILGNYSHIWVYMVGPLVGALLAVLAAIVLRGAGGDPKAARAAQGGSGPIFIPVSRRHDSEITDDASRGGGTGPDSGTQPG